MSVLNAQNLHRTPYIVLQAQDFHDSNCQDTPVTTYSDKPLDLVTSPKVSESNQSNCFAHRNNLH